MSLLLVTGAMALPSSAAVSSGCSTGDAAKAQHALNAIAEAAGGLNGYTGVELKGSCGSLTVYAAAQRSSALAATAKAAAAGVPLRFVTVAHSMAHLQRVHEQLITINDQLLARGITVRNFWPDIVTGRETVGVPASMSAATRAVVQAAVGDDVVVTTTKLADVRPTQAGNRSNDLTPFSAGNFIATLDSGCSSGAGVHTGATRQMLTAGHCSTSGSGGGTVPATGIKFYNEYYDASGLPQGSKLPMGSTSKNLWNSHYDISVLNLSPANSSREVWMGVSPSGSRQYQNPARASQAGNSICTSGAYEGQVCGTVQSYNLRGCINLALDPALPDSSECGQVYATSTALIVGHGDSGGPVVVNDPSGAGYPMTGIISASEGTAFNCTNYAFRNASYQGGACAKHVFYTDLPIAMTKAGVSLNTAANP